MPNRVLLVAVKRDFLLHLLQIIHLFFNFTRPRDVFAYRSFADKLGFESKICQSIGCFVKNMITFFYPRFLLIEDLVDSEVIY